MKYCKIKPNDIANGNGIVVSLWTQGCPHRCKGCQNPETWDINGGKEFDPKITDDILEMLDKDGIKRDFSVLGGEPLCPANYSGVMNLLSVIKSERPHTKVYLWTGYTLDELLKKYCIREFKNIDVLIDGRYEEDKRDLSLKYCGSTNQRVIDMQETIKQNKIILL